MNPTDLRYSEEHEWVRIESDGVVTVGITKFASESLGDVVFLELPAVGSNIRQFEKMGEIESVKAVSDLYAPISGSVLERNQQAIEKPELVNNDPFGIGWLIKVSLHDGDERSKLMSAKEYGSFLASKDN